MFQKANLLILCLLFVGGFGCEKKEPEKKEKTSGFYERSGWKDVSKNLKVSLKASPVSIREGERLVLELKATNIGKETLRLDASPPTRNDCKLIVVDPKGRRQVVQDLVDRNYRMRIRPGETRKWRRGSSRWLDVWVSDFDKGVWFRRQIPGSYTLVWQLNNAISDPVRVELSTRPKKNR